MLWDRETLGSPRRAIVWQDRRTAGLCDQLRADGHEPRVAALTGLRLDPYFSATKLAWIALNEPHVWAQVDRRTRRRRHGRLLPRRAADAAGCTTSPTRPTPRARCSTTSTPAPGAPSCATSSGVPIDALPEVVAVLRRRRAHRPARRSSASTSRWPGIAGDQQAALFGQACFAARHEQVHLRHGILRPGQHRRPSGRVVDRAAHHRRVAAPRRPARPTRSRARSSSPGAAVQWLRDGLQIIAQRRRDRGARPLGARLRRRGLRARR